MIEAIYLMYKEQKRMVKHEIKADSEELKNIIAESKLAMAILDEKQPEYKERYEREQAMYASFTPEQKDFISWQIGDWYLHIKPLLEGQHNLGHKKELLKSMICGEE